MSLRLEVILNRLSVKGVLVLTDTIEMFLTFVLTIDNPISHHYSIRALMRLSRRSPLTWWQGRITCYKHHMFHCKSFEGSNKAHINTMNLDINIGLCVKTLFFQFRKNFFNQRQSR